MWGTFAEATEGACSTTSQGHAGATHDGHAGPVLGRTTLGASAKLSAHPDAASVALRSTRLTGSPKGRTVTSKPAPIAGAAGSLHRPRGPSSAFRTRCGAR